ncbi:hypothetical protein AB4K20DRAFT_1869005 [Rhizopus microsporus]
MEISADSIKFMQEKILNIHPIGCYKGQMAASGFISIRRCYVIHKVLSEQIAQASICLESARLQLLRQLVLAITFEGSARRCQVYFHNSHLSLVQNTNLILSFDDMEHTTFSKIYPFFRHSVGYTLSFFKSTTHLADITYCRQYPQPVFGRNVKTLDKS